MKMADVRAKFVSQKISKIRWKPPLKQALKDVDTFATGSWDDEQNKVSLWRIEKQQPDGSTMDESGMMGMVQKDPELICEAPHNGNVTGLEFIGQENLVVSSSSSGTVTLYKHHTNSQTLGIVHQWDKIHRHAIDRPSPCTCIATRDEVIVSAGEDGRIDILHIGQKSPDPYRDIRDSSTINSIIFLKQTEFVTVNSTGQLKIYDMRINSSQPTQTLSLTGDLSPLQCIDKHPGQPHIITTGGQDGTLGIWDLRHDKFPISLLEAHSKTMWEVKFHKQNPDHIFTCSEDGSVWHWDASNVNSVAMATGSTPLLAGTGAGSGGGLSTTSHFKFSGSSVGDTSPWLATDIAKNKIEINELVSEDFCKLPVNSIDIEGNRLLCGTEGETVLQISLPLLR